MNDDETREDFVEEQEGSPNRTFAILAGGLLGLLILLMLCTLAFAWMQRSQRAQEIAEIEMQNATVQAQNRLVTQTIEALQTEAARPTDTPTSTPTPVPPTPTVTPTVTPTETPVVQPVEEESPTPDILETAVAGVVGTPTPGTPLPAVVTPGIGPGTLPQTGIGAWGALAAAFVFVILLVAARRLRSG